LGTAVGVRKGAFRGRAGQGGAVITKRGGEDGPQKDAAASRPSKGRRPHASESEKKKVRVKMTEAKKPAEEARRRPPGKKRKKKQGVARKQ